MTRSSEDAVPQKSAPSPNKGASSKSVADKGSPAQPDAASTAATAASIAATSTTANSTTESGSAAQRDRRRRILDATLALASKGGYDAVQMRTVAEKADVAVGTLYRYFPSKVHLLVSALAREFERIEGRRKLPPGQTAVPFDLSDDHLGFDTYDTVTQARTSEYDADATSPLAAASERDSR